MGAGGPPKNLKDVLAESFNVVVLDDAGKVDPEECIVVRDEHCKDSPIDLAWSFVHGSHVGLPQTLFRFSCCLDMSYDRDSIADGWDKLVVGFLNSPRSYFVNGRERETFEELEQCLKSPSSVIHLEVLGSEAKRRIDLAYADGEKHKFINQNMSSWSIYKHDPPPTHFTAFVMTTDKDIAGTACAMYIKRFFGTPDRVNVVTALYPEFSEHDGEPRLLCSQVSECLDEDARRAEAHVWFPVSLANRVSGLR
jgi:hypothetical protein